MINGLTRRDFFFALAAVGVTAGVKLPWTPIEPVVDLSTDYLIGSFGGFEVGDLVTFAGTVEQFDAVITKVTGGTISYERTTVRPVIGVDEWE